MEFPVISFTPEQLATAIIGIAALLKAMDAIGNFAAKCWKKHKAPEESQNDRLKKLESNQCAEDQRIAAVEQRLNNVKRIEKSVDDLQKGILAVLHDRMYQLCRYYIRLGYITPEGIKNLECLYNPYHDMGGNGTGTELYKRAKALPIKED